MSKAEKISEALAAASVQAVEAMGDSIYEMSWFDQSSYLPRMDDEEPVLEAA